jgi:hypothetical protein
MSLLDTLFSPAPSRWDALTGGDPGASLSAERARDGGTLTLSGAAYPCVSAPVTDRERALLMEGMGTNVADADLRFFNLDPSCPLSVDQSAVWSGNGLPYTVMAIRPVILRQSVVALRVIGFRTPPADAATVETASDLRNGAPVTPGVRKSYRPPDNQG